MLLGVGYMIYLYRTTPERVIEVGTVHLDLAPEMVEEGVVPAPAL
jgi:hypothetical protein